MTCPYILSKRCLLNHACICLSSAMFSCTAYKNVYGNLDAQNKCIGVLCAVRRHNISVTVRNAPASPGYKRARFGMRHAIDRSPSFSTRCSTLRLVFPGGFPLFCCGLVCGRSFRRRLISSKITRTSGEKLEGVSRRVS